MISEDTVAPVHFGNTLKPMHAKEAPEVNFDAKIELTGDKVNPMEFYPIFGLKIKHLAFGRA